jgi:hypothetical protein
MKSHLTQLSAIQVLSKQAFIKIFLDLTDKGFLRSESDVDILSTNNKIALGLRAKDLHDILFTKLAQLDLPRAI